MGRFPWAEYLAFEVLFVIFFYPTRQRAYRAVILISMIYLAAQLYLTREATDLVTLQYAAAFTAVGHFTFITYILLAERSFPDNWRRVRDEVGVKADAASLDKLPSNFTLTKKLWWMVDISWSMRMIGWIQEPRNGIPPRPSPSRRTFLRKTFLKLIMNIIIADLTAAALDYLLHYPTDNPKTYLAAVPPSHRLPHVLVWSMTERATISSAHNAIALVCVGLGHSSPTLWPDIWGSWGNAYTVRRLWGQSWHQQLRTMLGGLARLIANKFFKFPRGTKLSSYSQLYLVFFLSAIIHSFADLALEERNAFRPYKFFFFQVVAITFEDLVINFAKSLLHRSGIELKPGKADDSWAEVGVRVIGYCWVLLWLCLTLPAWVDEPNAIGFRSSDRRPITEFLLNKWKRWT